MTPQDNQEVEMSGPRKLWVDLNDEEVDTLAALQSELGLGTLDDVMHALIRQAHTRASIVCPACGHSAQVTAEQEARCDSCMSILRLTDDVWTVAVSRSSSS
jgi:hypothetical protein